METNQPRDEIIMGVSMSLAIDFFLQVNHSKEAPPCECDHGTEEEYVPCDAPASFRLIFDCDCGGDHGKTVVLFCAQCKNTLFSNHGTEGVTVLPL